jgi:hypothetical protein
VARGGYRPGAGRKPGKSKKSKEKDELKRIKKEEAEKIKEILSYGIKAKTKIYNDYLKRVQNGDKLTATEIKTMDKIEDELKSTILDKSLEKKETETPLDFMLRIMNDPNQEQSTRERMAVAAAPYIHSRKSEGIGKKEDIAQKAEDVAKTKFGTWESPLKVVK